MSLEGAPPLGPRPTVRRVSTSAIRANVRAIDAYTGPGVRILAVAKADGYGHGAIAVGHAMVGAGVWGLAVSLVEEAVELRNAGITAPIVVLGGVYANTQALVVGYDLRPVVWEATHLRTLARQARSSGVRCAVHLKVDTGMTRLGVLPGDLSALLEVYESECADVLELEGVMTHLACADEEDDTTSAVQLAAFSEVLGTLRGRGHAPSLRHVCNSSGIVTAAQGHYDMVRPGIALYGAAAREALEIPGLVPAMSVESRLTGLREVPAGSKVSYGHTETLTRDSVLGIVPVGYEDGYPRRVSGRAYMLVNGEPCPVVGRVTMDTCMIDVTNCSAASGDLVTLMGRQGERALSVYTLADWAGVIPYEILCGFSKRVPRLVR